MKKIIRSIFNQLGYEIIKVPKTPLFSRETVVTVGKFSIKMPNVNPLISTYRSMPNFASELSRITRAVADKYPDTIILDIGANVGDTLALLKSVSDFPVIAVEGDPFSFSYLSQNAKQFQQVILINQYLGEQNESKPLRFDKAGWNTTLIPDSKSGTPTALQTLDAVLKSRQADTGRIHLVKLDTEGFDTVILRGARELLNTVSPVIYMEYNRDNMRAIGEDGLQTLLGLKAHGYENVLIFDDKGRFILAEKLSNREAITNLHEYADGINSSIYYYNLCLFHERDQSIFDNLNAGERERRRHVE